jgi:ribosomal protein S15P/S13E
MMLVSNRRSQLDYLKKVSAERYAKLISSLGLRK